MFGTKYIPIMSVQKFIGEIICFVVALCLFYEGLYLLFRVDQFDLWLKYLPLMNKIHIPLSYVLPLVEIILALLMLWSRTRRIALLIMLVGCIGFLLYLTLSLLLSNKFFLPFHPYWTFMKWFHKMLIVLSVSWLIFGLLVFKKNDLRSDKRTTRAQQT